MSSNQEFRHYSLKELHNAGGQAVVLEEDHIKGFAVGGGPTTGTYNERKLAWLKQQAGVTADDLPGAEVQYAESGGAINWSSIGGKNADEGPIPVEGNCSVSESGLLVTVAFDINIAGDASAGFTVYYEELAGQPIKTASIAGGVISGAETRITLEGTPIGSNARVYVDYSKDTGSIKRADSAPVAASFWGQRIPNGSQQRGAFDTGYGEGFA